MAGVDATMMCAPYRQMQLLYCILCMFACTCVAMLHTVRALQENVIRSHACGVGKPLPPKLSRMLLALRISTIAKGYRYLPHIQ